MTSTASTWPLRTDTSFSNEVTASPSKRRRYTPASSPGKFACPLELVSPLRGVGPSDAIVTPEIVAPLGSVTVMAMPPRPAAAAAAGRRGAGVVAWPPGAGAAGGAGFGAVVVGGAGFGAGGGCCVLGAGAGWAW